MLEAGETNSRCTVIVGATGHLGSRLVHRLLEGGWNVIAVSRDPIKLESLRQGAMSADSQLSLLSGDGYENATLDLIQKTVAERSWSLEGWVNNANGVSPSNQLLSLDVARLQEDLGSLAKLMVATEFAAKAMIQSGSKGSIVNIASMYGLVSPDPRLYSRHEEWRNPPAYGVVKAGIINFTRYCAAHLGSTGIRVNSVSPGPFPRLDGSVDEDFIGALSERVPLRRTGAPSEFAGVVSFLLEDDSSFMTGENVVVDGGWTLW